MILPSCIKDFAVDLDSFMFQFANWSVGAVVLNRLCKAQEGLLGMDLTVQMFFCKVSLKVLPL